MTLEQALEQIKSLMPYYSRCRNAEAERDMWRKQCLDLNTKMYPPEAPQIIKTLTAVEIRDIYYECGIEIHNKDFFMFPSDGEYWLISLDDVKRFIAWDWTNLMTFGAWLDCDDYAAHLWGATACPGWSGIPMAYTEGIVYGQGHAICSIVAGDPPEVYFLEPQNDSFLTSDIQELFTVRLH